MFKGLLAPTQIHCICGVVCHKVDVPPVHPRSSRPTTSILDSFSTGVGPRSILGGLATRSVRPRLRLSVGSHK